MKQFFKELDFSIVLLFLYAIKSTFISFGFVDPCIIFVLALVFISKKFLKQYFNLKHSEYELALLEFDYKKTQQTDDQYRDYINQEIEKMRTDISNVKIAQGFGKR